MRVKFEVDQEGWVDVASGEYEYDGDVGLLKETLETVDQWTDVHTQGPEFGLDEGPGKVFEPMDIGQRAEIVQSQVKSLGGDVIDVEKSLQVINIGKDSAATSQWVPYQGPQGGEGWQNAGTGDVVYDDEPPGDTDVDPEAYHDADIEDLLDAVEEVTGEDMSEEWSDMSDDQIREAIQEMANSDQFADVMEELSTDELFQDSSKVVTGVNERKLRSYLKGKDMDELIQIAEDVGADQDRIDRYSRTDSEFDMWDLIVRSVDKEDAVAIARETGNTEILYTGYEVNTISGDDVEEVSEDEFNSRASEYDIDEVDSDGWSDVQRGAVLGSLEVIDEIEGVDTLEEGGQMGSFDPTSNLVQVSEWATPEAIEEADYFTDDPRHIAIHEIGHAAHYAAMSEEKAEELNEKRPDSYNSVGEWDGSDVASEIDGIQSSHNPFEFVAEVWTGLQLGVEFEDDVMEVYYEWGGPEV